MRIAVKVNMRINLLFLVWAGAAAMLTDHLGATDRFVSPTGNSTSPYTNWATAATNILDAVRVANTNAGDTVWVANWTYTLTNQIVVSNIILRSINGYAFTFLNGNYPATTNRGVYINHPNGILMGFTISNAFAPGLSGEDRFGGGIYISSGTVSNCLIQSCTAQSGGGIYTTNGNVYGCLVFSNTATQYAGGGVYMLNSNSLMKDTTIRGNLSTNWVGGGVYLNGAEIRNCVIEANAAPRTDTAGYGDGGGVNMNAGFIRNCVIALNTAGLRGGGIYMTAGTIETCTVRSNVAVMVGNSDGGGMFINNGTIRNCLFSENVSGYRGGACYVLTAAEIENVTVCSNRAGTYSGGLFLTGAAAKIANSIIYFNSSSFFENYSGTTATFTNCCTTPSVDAYGTGNTTNNPLLVNVPGGNYRLTPSSPGINTGINRSWMDGALDLDGHARKDRFSGIVDMGAYEYLPRASLMGVY